MLVFWSAADSFGNLKVGQEPIRKVHCDLFAAVQLAHESFAELKAFVQRIECTTRSASLGFTGSSTAKEIDAFGLAIDRSALSATNQDGVRISVECSAWILSTEGLIGLTRFAGNRTVRRSGLSGQLQAERCSLHYGSQRMESKGIAVKQITGNVIPFDSTPIKQFPCQTCWLSPIRF